MPLPDPSASLKNAPVADLVILLLRQFQRLLQTKAPSLSLTKATMQTLSDAIAAGNIAGDDLNTLREALRVLVTESLHDLETRFGLTFTQSLQADMATIGGWQTTAEFIAIANHKSNAELRITAGTTLLTLMRDFTYSDHLLTVIRLDNNTNDVDTVLAKRALHHVSGIQIQSINDLSDIATWLSQHP